MSNKKRLWGSSIEKNRKRRRRNEFIHFDKIKDDLANKTGRVRSNDENALIIQSLAYFQKQSFSLDQSCKKCVEAFGGCHTVYQNLWNYYIKYNDLNIASTHEKKGAQFPKLVEIDELNEDEMNAIINFAFDYTVKNNTGFNVQDLLTFLLEEHSIILDEYTARYILIDLNFTWSN